MRPTRDRFEDPAVSLIFSALGDPTRLRLVRRLVDREPLSVTQLGEGLPVTRQGVAKHLRVLADAGVVVARKRGRERLYTLEAGSVQQARDVLDRISAGWDRALQRLKSLVEED
jgi:DNA-binding transcriptional ArsR family regulator